MTRMLQRSRPLLRRFLSVCTLAPFCAIGCHCLNPGPVEIPPPPPLVCLDLPPAHSACETQPSPSRSIESPSPIPPWAVESQPIDLPTALQLANGQNPAVALARERIRQALAQQDLAELLWVPNLEIGSTWMRHDGQIQRAVGEVFPTSRSSLFVGGGPALSLSLSKAIFAPLAARQITSARQAGAAGVTNEQLLDVALAYIEMQQVHAQLQIVEEALRNARRLLYLTETYERVGKGKAADTARSRTEVQRRERQRIEIQGQLRISSARVVQLLQLPPQLFLQPLEPAVVPIALIPEDLPLAELLTQALANNPELAENRALITADLEIWRSAKLAPLLPDLRLSYAAGGYGGGINSFFGDFDGRSDFAATVVWQLQNLGLGNLAWMRDRRSQYAQATFRQASLEARVAEQVVKAFSETFARRTELAAAQREVQAARESYRLNEEYVRRAPDRALPIELLQAVQALAQARFDYLRVVTDYNRSQFELYTALGNIPLCALPQAAPVPTTESTVPPVPESHEQLPPPRPVQKNQDKGAS